MVLRMLRILLSTMPTTLYASSTVQMLLVLPHSVRFMLSVGQPITVTLDAEVNAPRGPASGGFSRPRGPRGPRGFNRGPPRQGGGRMDGGGGRGRGGPRAAPGERRERQPHRTQEDLDKELEDFMSAPPPGENGNGEGNGEEMALD
jgi:hypothetical protein